MTIRIEWDEHYGGFEGWGTSLAWWGHRIGSWQDREQFAKLMDLLFDPSIGLGLNIVRYNIGGGERPGPNTLRPGGDVPGFQPEKGQWDWDADAGQRAVLAEAIRRGVTVAEAFSNSPPYWMTVSGSVTGAEGGGNNLREDAYEEFADYLTEVVRLYRDKWGITFRTLNPLNEPTSPWWKLGNIQEGCYFGLEEQASIIRKTRAALRAKGLTGTAVSANDDNSIDETIEALHAYDAETLAAIGQINTHSYNGTGCEELRRLAAGMNARLWMSEYGTGGTGPHDHGDMTSVFELAARIMKDLATLKPAAWVYWQAVEDEGADNNWGFIHAPFDGEETFEMTKQYDAMAQFSRFIRPGALIAPTDDERCIAAYHPNGGELVLVVRNPGEGCTVRVDTAPCRIAQESAAVYRTTRAERVERVDGAMLAHGVLTLDCPAGSISTVVLSDATLQI